MKQKRLGGLIIEVEGMQKRKLIYQFHKPNTEEKTAEYILSIFLDVDRKKVERNLAKELEKEEKQ